MTQHAIYAPSSMAQTVQCPASVKLQQLYPEQPDESSIEGEAAHWACAELAHGRVVGVGQIAPNGVAIDDDMLEAAELWCETMRPDLGGLHIEERVNMPRIHRQCWGTPDGWRQLALTEAIRQAYHTHIELGDVKYGHEYVDEYENWQLISYAAGVIDALRLDGQQELGVLFDLTIVQPRCYGRKPVRTWRVPASELRAYWNQAQAACDEAGLQPRTIVGPSCKHCTARHACDALQRAGLSAIDVAGQAEPLDLPTPAAAAELRRLRYAVDLMSARASGLEQQLMSVARQGEAVPGFHIEHSDGREQWRVPAEQVIALGEMYGKDLRKRAVLTPAQARKAGVLTDGLTERKTGAAQLVVDTPHQMVRLFKGS